MNLFAGPVGGVASCETWESVQDLNYGWLEDVRGTREGFLRGAGWSLNINSTRRLFSYLDPTTSKLSIPATPYIFHS